MTDTELMQKAIRARLHAYAPYSGFSVGAALLCADGSVFCGANIENAAFSPSVCAERVALFSAVFAGHRDFVAIAVAGGKGDDLSPTCTPCGVCRQALAEFCGRDLRVIVHTEKGLAAHTLGELLPLAFTKEEL